MKRKFTAAAIVLLSVMMIFTACGKAVSAPPEKKHQSPSVQSEQNIDKDQAINVIKNMIPDHYGNYQISLVNPSLQYKGNEYYQFSILNGSSKSESSVIVSKNNGEILCYYPDSTATELNPDKVFQLNF